MTQHSRDTPQFYLTAPSPCPYLGGKEDDFGYAIAVDGAGNAYITGQTLSTNFPTATNYLAATLPMGASFRNVMDGTNDAFVSKIILNATVPPLFIKYGGPITSDSDVSNIDHNSVIVKLLLILIFVFIK